MATGKRCVYLLMTRTNNEPPIIHGVYSRGSYEIAYNRLADIAEKRGKRLTAGAGRVSVYFNVEEGGIGSDATVGTYWLERWEVE